MEDWQQWEYFDYQGELKSKRTKICITYTHFDYRTKDQCVIFLTCPFHRKLIPQGDHLVKGCSYWRKDIKVFAQEAA